MTKRTAADFAREARDGIDSYEIELATGKLVPLKPVREASLAEFRELDASRSAYAVALNAGAEWPADRLTPREVQVKIMTGTEVFEEFWEEWRHVPGNHVETMMTECDEHFYPPPKDPGEEKGTGDESPADVEGKSSAAVGSSTATAAN